MPCILFNSRIEYWSFYPCISCIMVNWMQYDNDILLNISYQNYHWPGWRFKKQGKRKKFMTIASTFFSAIIVSQYPTFPLQISRLFSEAVIGKFSKYDEASTPYLGTLLMFQWSLACIVFNNSFSSSTTPCI